MDKKHFAEDITPVRAKIQASEELTQAMRQTLNDFFEPMADTDAALQHLKETFWQLSDQEKADLLGDYETLREFGQTLAKKFETEKEME